jgi:hypothetical protein
MMVLVIGKFWLASGVLLLEAEVRGGCWAQQDQQLMGRCCTVECQV